MYRCAEPAPVLGPDLSTGSCHLWAAAELKLQELMIKSGKEVRKRELKVTLDFGTCRAEGRVACLTVPERRRKGRWGRRDQVFGVSGCHRLCRRKYEKGHGEPTSRRKIGEGTLQRCQRIRRSIRRQECACCGEKQRRPQWCWRKGIRKEVLREGLGTLQPVQILDGAEAGPAHHVQGH